MKCQYKRDHMYAVKLLRTCSSGRKMQCQKMQNEKISTAFYTSIRASFIFKYQSLLRRSILQSQLSFLINRNILICCNTILQTVSHHLFTFFSPAKSCRLLLRRRITQRNWASLYFV